MNSTKLDEIKSYFNDKCKSTTIHAIPNIFKTKKCFIKLLWVIESLLFLNSS